MQDNNSNWEPSNEEKLGPIYNSYNVICKELELLKSKTSCPDKFIYDFLGAIQNEWHHENCSTKAS